MEIAATNDDAGYSLGSVLNHVLLHQTVIGQEAIKQMEMAGDYPTSSSLPFGGGSNFAGISFPFLRHKLTEGKKILRHRRRANLLPKLTRGVFRYDFGDTVGMTPLLPMYTLGHTFVPAGRSMPAAALPWRRRHRQPVAQADGIIEAAAVDQIETFEAGILFAKAEGIIPAPEANHGIACHP